MFSRTTTISGTLLVCIGTTSCLALMGAKEKLVMESAAFDLGCDPSLLTIRQIGKDAFRVLGCNKKASYVVECASADSGSCKAVLISVTN
jgi:hypothetical protein